MALRVHICTWNVMSTQPPDVDLRELLHLENEEDIPDIVAVGLQEVDAKPQSLLIEYIKENSWVKLLQAYLGAYGLVKLRSIRMLGMVHLVSVHMRHLSHIREIRPAFCKTALLGLLECQSVSDYVTFSNCTPKKIPEHDYVFWLGDFNYRINESSENIKGLCSRQEYSSLWQHDQLLQSQGQNLCFVGYKEGPLSFSPTYKYNPGTNDWDTESGKFRKPAWTDRVLWKTNQDKTDTVQLVTYKSHDQYMPSDHKPVSASLTVDIQDSMSNIEDPIDWKMDLMSMPWYGNEDGLCVYVIKNYKTYSWDWIGLYRVGFHHLWDYEMYEWAVGDGDEYGENGCAVLFDCLPEESGHYVMAYYSYKMEGIISISEPFEVRITWIGINNSYIAGVLTIYSEKPEIPVGKTNGICVILIGKFWKTRFSDR
ncbi:hypothetical protein QZH41_008360, partial [Actinostola sp. cb2023]